MREPTEREEEEEEEVDGGRSDVNVNNKKMNQTRPTAATTATNLNPSITCQRHRSPSRPQEHNTLRHKHANIRKALVKSENAIGRPNAMRNVEMSYA